MRAPPAYQEYPSDLLANENYRLMSLEERGFLHTLRHYCWVNDSVPGTIDDLSELLGITRSQVDLVFTPRVRTFFSEKEDSPNRLISPELVDYKRELQERSSRRSEAGRIGGRKSADSRASVQAKVQQPVQATAEVRRVESELKSGEQGWGEDSRVPF